MIAITVSQRVALAVGCVAVVDVFRQSLTRWYWMTAQTMLTNALEYNEEALASNSQTDDAVAALRQKATDLLARESCYLFCRDSAETAILANEWEQWLEDFDELLVLAANVGGGLGHITDAQVFNEFLVGQLEAYRNTVLEMTQKVDRLFTVIALEEDFGKMLRTTARTFRDLRRTVRTHGPGTHSKPRKEEY